MDPNILGEFMKNPEMMKMVMNLAKKNPELLEKITNMQVPMKEDLSVDKDNLSVKKKDNFLDKKFKLDQEVEIMGLITDKYNGEIGLIQNYHAEKDRYEVYFKQLEKSLYLKEVHLKIT